MITGRTRIYTILAHPSTYVMAPTIYNHIFASMGLDMAYIAHDVSPEAVSETVKSFSGWSNLGGFNVTIPHKETVAALLDDLCEVSARIGVVNTVLRLKDGTLSGFNTDGIGAVGALGKVSGDTCLMIGAGGAARAIADALVHAGVRRIFILNRSRQSALRLLNICKSSKVSIYADEPLKDISLVVQATPMADEIPLGLDPAGFAPGTRILETVMRPTALAEAASHHGLDLITGHAMLYHQTARNFELLTGLGLPKKLLDAAFASAGFPVP